MKKILLGFVLGVLLASTPMRAQSLSGAVDRAIAMMQGELELINEYANTIHDMNAVGDDKVHTAYMKHYSHLVKLRNNLDKIANEKD